eukprot:TRINITY_DN4119_c0_g1_i1.p1 TRINITY_DN4119_c0_g1~~TRINITY_DN4119_c0_g1_i1.p1  ORF type:complete len:520 (-),score=92.10 TRINITY_DN4119_c0_g1_i1:93-1652(-)
MNESVSERTNPGARELSLPGEPNNRGGDGVVEDVEEVLSVSRRKQRLSLSHQEEGVNVLEELGEVEGIEPEVHVLTHNIVNITERRDDIKTNALPVLVESQSSSNESVQRVSEHEEVLSQRNRENPQRLRGGGIASVSHEEGEDAQQDQVSTTDGKHSVVLSQSKDGTLEDRVIELPSLGIPNITGKDVATEGSANKHKRNEEQSDSHRCTGQRTAASATMRVALLLISLMFVGAALGGNILTGDIWDSKTWELDYPIFQGPVFALTEYNTMLAISGAYLVLLGIFSFFMRHRRNATPPKPLWVFPISLTQNFLMFAYSLYAFIGTTLTLYKNWKSVGFDIITPFCDVNDVMRQDMDFWFYTFYLSKFLEYVDSFLLVAKAKPLLPPGNTQYFLHVFHHSVTASIVWFAWKTQFSGAWVGPLTNAFVHTFMYGYYFFTDLGMPRTYGGVFITPIQLIQFVLAMLTTVYESIYSEKCGTNMQSMLWLWFTYSVFLVLFIKLFLDKKRSRQAARAAKKKTA